MYPTVDERSIKKSHPPVRILLAEADPAKIEQVASFTERHFQSSIRVCKIYADLLPMLKEELPELLLLGILDRFNSFDTCQECHQIWKDLPIVLLSRQNSIDDYFHHFRKLAMTKGATDVVTNDLLHLNKLLQGLPLQTAGDKVASTISAVSVQTMLTALQEINEVGNNYFGPLAQGNYWRKAHTRIVAEFPALENWSADHFGMISCHETMLQSQCTEADLQSLRNWVGGYILECERIIVDFREILKNSALSAPTHELLLNLVSFSSNIGNSKSRADSFDNLRIASVPIIVQDST
jgi:CheY-like chemotaxis protein